MTYVIAERYNIGGDQDITIENYRDTVKNGDYLIANSDTHLFMHEQTETAREPTSKINETYHTQEELNNLFSELFGYQVDGSFRCFPPFHTDFGKNIKVGKDVFYSFGVLPARSRRHYHRGRLPYRVSGSIRPSQSRPCAR